MCAPPNPESVLLLAAVRHTELQAEARHVQRVREARAAIAREQPPGLDTRHVRFGLGQRLTAIVRHFGLAKPMAPLAPVSPAPTAPLGHS
jgi:hypothetical protein